MSRINIRRLLISGITILLITGASVAPGFAQDSFSCTEVIGFSQSWQWFTGKSMSEARNNVSVSEDAFLSNWQGRFEY